MKNEVDPHTECLLAMQEFIDRCDAGHVHSTYTYNKFKDIIARHTGIVANEPPKDVDAVVQAWCEPNDSAKTNPGATPAA